MNIGFFYLLLSSNIKRNSEDTLTKGIPRGTGSTLNYPLSQEQQRFNFSNILHPTIFLLILSERNFTKPISTIFIIINAFRILESIINFI